MKRKFYIALAAIAAMLTIIAPAATASTHHASTHHASIAPAITSPRPEAMSASHAIPYSWHTTHCYKVPVRHTDLGKESDNTANATFETVGQDYGDVDVVTNTFSPICVVNVGTSGWQQFKDSSGTGDCAQFDSGLGYFIWQPCANTPSQLMWTTLFTSPYYIIANQWGDNNHSQFHCPASAPDPVWEAGTTAFPIELGCRPDGTHAYYSQLWQAIAVT